MKKLILLFFVLTLSLASCGSDDGGDSSQGDALVGTWKVFQRFLNGTQQTLDNCELMGIITVKSNGTFTSESFDDNGSSCESDGVDNGLWENLGNNSYKITSDVGTQDEEVFTTTFNFENNTFWFELTEGQDVLRSVYIRQ
jgi:hypothetical protein